MNSELDLNFKITDVDSIDELLDFPNFKSPLFWIDLISDIQISQFTRERILEIIQLDQFKALIMIFTIALSYSGYVYIIN